MDYIQHEKLPVSIKDFFGVMKVLDHEKLQGTKNFLESLINFDKSNNSTDVAITELLKDINYFLEYYAEDV